MLPTSLLTASSRRRVDDGSMSGLAYHAIRAKIIALELPPASLVDEAALARELNVGLTPVRQALRRLALENLIVILPRRGTIVADLNASDLAKIYEMRLELEPLAVRLAVRRATPEQQTAMVALCRDYESALHPVSNGNLLALDCRMHQILWLSAHNEFLEESLDRLYSHALRLWNFALHRATNLDQSIHEHIAIFAALRQGDQESAESMMRAHINHFQTEMTSLFA